MIKTKKYYVKRKNLSRKYVKQSAGGRFGQLGQLGKTILRSTATAAVRGIQTRPKIAPKLLQIQPHQVTAPHIRTEFSKNLYQEAIGNALKQPKSRSASNSGRRSASNSGRRSASSSTSSDLVPFNKIASSDWRSPTFKLREKVLKGKDLYSKKKRLLELVDKYNEKKGRYAGIIQSLYYLNLSLKNTIDHQIADIHREDNEYNKKRQERLIVTYNKTTDTYQVTKPRYFERQGTFTWNFLHNTDISYKEIKISYCEKWNKWSSTNPKPEICDIETKKDVAIFVGKFIVRSIGNFISSLGRQPLATTSMVTPQEIKEITNESRTPYFGNTYIPILRLGINLNAVWNTTVSVITGWWGQHWLNNILGIITPIVSEIFDDVGHSSENKLNILTFLLSKITLIEENEIEDLINNSTNLTAFKEKLEIFIVTHHDLFDREYKNNQFTAASRELVQAIDRFKEQYTSEIAEDLKRNLLTAILFTFSHDDDNYDTFFREKQVEVDLMM